MLKCPKRRISPFVEGVFIPRANFVSIFCTSHATTRSKFTNTYNENARVKAEQGHTERTVKFYYYVVAYLEMERAAPSTLLRLP